MGRKILIVEDEESHQNLLQRLLGRAGFETFVAGDGEQGKELLQRESFDLAIVDWNMPKMDGGQLARWIRKNSSLGRLPILMLTVRSRPQEEALGFESGIDDFLAKPYAPKELIARVERLLSLKCGE